MCKGAGIRGITKISWALHHQFLPLQDFYMYSKCVELCLHVSAKRVAFNITTS